MAKRPLQEINAGSMADIAFLLLIFFLVTTTMNTNTGMQRKLAALPEKDVKTSVEMIKRNVMIVLINKDNKIAIGGNPIHISNVTEKAKLFFKNPNNDPNLSEKTSKEIPFFGMINVTKGVISIQNDRGTSYEKYLQVQNELVRAINELRDEIAMEKFQLHYNELSGNKKEAVEEIYPLAISEAEPMEIIKK
jgi:biopolymer transport protein ExbD